MNDSPEKTVVLLRDREPGDEVLNALVKRYPDVDFRDTPDDGALMKNLPHAHAVIGGRWNEQMLAAASRLRWVQTIYAGLDDLPLEAFARRQVRVSNFRGVSAVCLSEHVLALMFAFARGLPELMRRQRMHVWLPSTQRPVLFELQGQRVGIVGHGTLGSAIAERCHRMGMEVVVCQRAPREVPAHVSAVYPMSALDEMLGTVDHLVLALPSTAATRGLMSAERLRALKAGAYLYNVGRGDAVAGDALLAALATGHLAGAGLDVTDPEPLPQDSPLWDLPNVIVTAHTAGLSPKRWQRGMEIVSENIGRFQRGEALVNLVQ
jgi:phosphoglycerate dehydrogenase-like enzyme